MKTRFNLLCLLLVQTATAFVKPNLFASNSIAAQSSNSPTWMKPIVLAMSNSPENESTVSPEYISLQPGSLLRIRIGDPAASRKAWKKRRRSGSPILIPCSILGTDRINSIRCNLRYLVQKYGRTLGEKYGGGKGGAQGIALKAKNVVGLWEKEFGSSLVQHADELGYDGIGSLLLSLFNSDDTSSTSSKGSSPTIQNQGVYVLKTDTNLLLYVPTMSVRRGRTSASTSSLIQMASGTSPESGLEIQHTGYVYSSSDEAGLVPLGAALRVNSNNALERISEDEIVSAYVFQYDPTGDNGTPLLVVSLDPPKSQFSNGRIANKKVDAQYKIRSNKMETANVKVNLMFDNLNVGDGPFKAKVVKTSSRSGAAFVDLGVGRKRGKNRGGGIEKILGMLRFDDMETANEESESAEEGTETIEDVSDLFEMSDDGSTIFSIDPETGDKSTIGSLDDEIDEDDDDEIDEDDDDDEDDLFAGMTAQERLDAIGEMIDDEGFSTPEAQTGDEMDVYIQSVSPQSRRFTVSLFKPSLSSKNNDKKQQKLAKKRLSKLSEDDTLRKMEELAGTECNGVVKAVSKSGDWFYVAPEIDEDEHLPQVGVAHPIQESETDFSAIVAGTRVRVRLEGIDEKRGQLSMSLLGMEE